MGIGPILRAMIQNKIAVLLLLIEVAVTLAIVLNCGSMVITQRKRLIRDTGLAEEELLLISYEPYGEVFADLEYRDQVNRADLAAMRNLPGVIDATKISPTPLQGGGSSMITRVDGEPSHKGVRTPVYSVDANFLKTLGLELVAGRNFVPEDFPTEPGPYAANAIVTQDLADALFPDGDALGKVIDTGSAEYKDTIVGIVRHMFTPFGGGPMETRIVFYPNINLDSSAFLVRVQPDSFSSHFTDIPELLKNRQAERVVSVRTMTDVKSGGLLFERMMVQMLSIVIGLLLFITGVGLAGMTAFAVARRTKQIGIRRALGASKRQILAYFLVENSLIIIGGTILGLLAGIALNIALVSSADVEPLPFGLTVGCIVGLLVLGWVATLLPALRSTKIEPAIATRTV